MNHPVEAGPKRRPRGWPSLGWAALFVTAATGACAQSGAQRASPTPPARAASASSTPAKTSAATFAPAKAPVTTATTPKPPAGSGVMLGIDVLAAQDFALLKGKRIGLLTHPAGVNRNGVSTIDVLRAAPGVKLTALYGPEHGIYGLEIAGAKIDDQIDKKTGLPVYSLHGATRRPTPEMLKGIDVMVVDLQDIGSRSYTFISCLRYTMEACFEANKTVVVLDRPNPLGGLKVGGPTMDPDLSSYVGAYPVPYVFGLTIGELAQISKDTPGWLKGPDEKSPMSEAVRKNGQLFVVPMRGWKRSMLWSDTGLRWIPTSPKITGVSAAFGYSLTGLGGEVGNFKHGVNTPYPFRLLNYPGKTPEQVAVALEALKLKGLTFTPRTYKDADGTERSGVDVRVADWNAVDPTRLAFEMMRLSVAWSTTGNPFAKLTDKEEHSFNILTGSNAWWEEITKQGGKADVAGFFQRWNAQDAKFQQWTRQWWKYPE